MRIVPRAEFQRMLAYAMRRLPVSVRPKNVEAAVLMMTERPPLDQLDIRIDEAGGFGDPPAKPSDE